MDRRKTDRRTGLSNDLYVLDIQAIGDTLWRRRRLMILIMLLIAVPAALYVFVKPDHYRATASVVLENQEVNLTEFQNALPPTAKLDDLTIETQVKLIASPTLIHQTLNKLASDPKNPNRPPAEKDEKARYEALREFTKDLSVATQGKSSVIGIAYTSKDPVEAARRANTHAEQYVTFQINNRKQQMALVNQWIEDQVAKLKEDSQTKSQEIQKFRTEAGIVPGKNSQELITQQITDLTEQLAPIETQKLSLQAKADALKATGGVEDVVNSSLIGNLKTQASEATQELKAITSSYGKSHPLYKATKQRVNQVNSDIAREKSNVRDAINTELAAATQQEEMLRTRLEELYTQAGELREKEIALAAMTAEEEANSTLLQNFLARYEELKSQLDFDRADVRVASQAEIPTDPVGPAKAFLLTIIVLFSAIAASVLVLLLGMLDHGIENADDVKKVLNLPLLGVLPKTRNALADVRQGKRSDYIEEIKRIYLALAIRKSPQTVLFTSAKDGEGKSTTLLAIAHYLRSIGARVVAVDADMTDATLSGLADASSSPGFAEYINGDAPIESCIHATGDGLSVMPSGNSAAHAPDLLAVRNLKPLIDALKTRYDYVLIDCAPALATTDAEIMAGVCDRAVLVAGWAGASKKRLKDVAMILRQHAPESPAVILTKRA